MASLDDEAKRRRARPSVGPWAARGGLAAAAVAALAALAMPGCGGEVIATGPECAAAGEGFCSGDVHTACFGAGPASRAGRTEECAPGTCTAAGCRVCTAGATECVDAETVRRCVAGGLGWEVVDECYPYVEACARGVCQGKCGLGAEVGSFEGCEFLGVPLDSAFFSDFERSYSIVVANGQEQPVRFEVAHVGAFGAAESAWYVAPPGGTRTVTFEGPRRVDGITRDGVLPSQRFTLTHSALTPSGFRIRSEAPVTAFQFSPGIGDEWRGLDGGDATLLLPTSVLGQRTTFLGEGQDVYPSEYAMPRGTLTVASFADATEIVVELGPLATAVQGLDGGVLGPGDRVEVLADAFEVLNLETAGVGSDLTGSIVTSSVPVAVFSGHEQAPLRRSPPLIADCCADHVQGQLLPDGSWGRRGILAPEPNRADAIRRASPDPIPPVSPASTFRLLAVTEGKTTVRTSLPAPHDVFTLDYRERRTVETAVPATFESDRPLAVVQIYAGSDAFTRPDGIGRGIFPGGDAAMVVVPPQEQYRDDYVFLVPTETRSRLQDGYPFDFVTVFGPAAAEVTLDGAPLGPGCDVVPVAGVGGRPTDLQVMTCSLSSPVLGPRSGSHDQRVVSDGEQGDGDHRLTSTRPVGVVVSGFGRGRSYAFAAGMNEAPLQ